MGRRLDDVRQRVGAPDLKAFYGQLVVGDVPDEFPSYAAVLTYHGAPYRDPPNAYLVRICDVFPDIRVEWLVTGRGSMTHSDALVAQTSEAAATSGDDPQTPQERREQIALSLKFEVLRGLGITIEPLDMPEGVDGAEMTQEQKVAAIDAWASAFNRQLVPHWVAPLGEVRRRMDPRKKILIGKKGVEAERAAQDELARRIGRAMRGPLEAFGIDPQDGLTSIHGTSGWLDDYLTSMVPVLLALAPRLAAATMRQTWLDVFGYEREEEPERDSNPDDPPFTDELGR